MSHTKPEGTDPAVNEVNIHLSTDFSGHCILATTLTPPEHAELKQGPGTRQV